MRIDSHTHFDSIRFLIANDTVQIIIIRYIHKHAQGFSYNFVQNWLVYQDFLAMISERNNTTVKGSFQNTIVATANFR